MTISKIWQTMTPGRGPTRWRPAVGLARLLLAAAAAAPGFAGATAAGALATSPASAASAASAPAMPGHGAIGRPARPGKTPPAPIRLVDINSASRKELMTLPGIGDAEADRIIAHRPYLTKTELVSKQVLPAGPYLSLKSRVVAMPKAKSKPKVAPA